MWETIELDSVWPLLFVVPRVVPGDVGVQCVHEFSPGDVSQLHFVSALLLAASASSFYVPNIHENLLGKLSPFDQVASASVLFFYVPSVHENLLEVMLPFYQVAFASVLFFYVLSVHENLLEELLPFDPFVACHEELSSDLFFFLPADFVSAPAALSLRCLAPWLESFSSVQLLLSFSDLSCVLVMLSLPAALLLLLGLA
jgi:hypothetical protein